MGGDHCCFAYAIFASDIQFYNAEHAVWYLNVYTFIQEMVYQWFGTQQGFASVVYQITSIILNFNFIKILSNLFKEIKISSLCFR